jgi:hypothetical protein
LEFDRKFGVFFEVVGNSMDVSLGKNHLVLLSVGDIGCNRRETLTFK